MRSRKGTEQRTPQGKYSDDEMDYLLSAGGLGGSQQARILAAVTQTVRRQQRRSPIRLLLGARWAGAAVAVTAACIIFWTWKGATPVSFRSKGAAPTPATATVEVECLRATLSACPRGSILAFSVSGADPGGYVTAYLSASDDTPATWLLLNEPTSAHAAGGGDLLARGARLPDTLEAGRYTVQVLVTNRPQSREQALDPLPAEIVARAQFTAGVLP